MGPGSGDSAWSRLAFAYVFATGFGLGCGGSTSGGAEHGATDGDQEVSSDARSDGSTGADADGAPADSSPPTDDAGVDLGNAADARGAEAGEPADGGNRLALRITEFLVPYPFDSMTVGPDRNIWFVSTLGGPVGYITPFGSVTAFWYGGIGAFPGTITAGPDGNLWFTDGGTGSIVRVTPTGTTRSSYPPTVRSGPSGIVAGPDGNLWFTEAANYVATTYNIGRLTPSFQFQEFVLPGHRSPQHITVGPDGNLWFTEFMDGVGRITTAGVATEFMLPTSNVFMNGIASGPDNALWVTGETLQHTGAFIGRVATSGSLTTYPLANSGASPQGITAGPDGNLWFVEDTANLIGRISPDGAVTEFAIPTPSAGLKDIILGPDGNLWFSETRASKVGYFPPTPVLAPVGGGKDGGADRPASSPDAGVADRPADLAGDASADRGGASDAGAGGATDASDAAVGTGCGFTIPNPASAGLPNPAQYDTSVTGIVRDAVTGLGWERALGGHQASLGCSTNLGGELACPLRYAEAYCAANRLGGFSDWRLPTELELLSLVDFTTFEAAIDLTAFPSTPWEPFWSGTRLAGAPDNAWIVDFLSGLASTRFIDEARRVRCVRTGTPSPNRCYPTGGRFGVQGTEVVDAATGLTWQRSGAPSTMAFDSATAYCSSLGSGFRLPSLNELSSIVDFTIPQSTGYMIDATAFANLAGHTFFWTSSPIAGGFQTMWTVDFQSGGRPQAGLTNTLVAVRCVR